jgi:hypothetical protein
VEEAILGRRAFGGLPDAFDAVELGRVRRQSSQLDAVTVLSEPGLRLFVETMARVVVDDQEDFPTVPTDELLEEREKRRAFEDGRDRPTLILRRSVVKMDRD